MTSVACIYKTERTAREGQEATAYECNLYYDGPKSPKMSVKKEESVTISTCRWIQILKVGRTFPCL